MKELFSIIILALSAVAVAGIPAPYVEAKDIESCSMEREGDHYCGSVGDMIHPKVGCPFGSVKIECTLKTRTPFRYRYPALFSMNVEKPDVIDSVRDTLTKLYGFKPTISKDSLSICYRWETEGFKAELDVIGNNKGMVLKLVDKIAAAQRYQEMDWKADFDKPVFGAANKIPLLFEWVSKDGVVSRKEDYQLLDRTVDSPFRGFSRVLRYASVRSGIPFKYEYYAVSPIWGLDKYGLSRERTKIMRHWERCIG